MESLFTWSGCWLAVRSYKKLDGVSRDRCYSPLIKSLAEDLPQNTLQEESSAKIEDS
jgi:hypothetical protein